MNYFGSYITEAYKQLSRSYFRTEADMWHRMAMAQNAADESLHLNSITYTDPLPFPTPKPILF